MGDKIFKVALLVGIYLVAVALFLRSENGRYEYRTDESGGLVVDTRTGEYWYYNGTHVEPRTARVTLHSPVIDDKKSDGAKQAQNTAAKPASNKVEFTRESTH